MLSSVHNIRIERLWRDIRKDVLESFRQLFIHLEECGLLDMDNVIHRTALFIVYQPLIQASLDRAREAWNNHRLRTEGHRTPRAIWELSKERAIQDGYWKSDPGDNSEVAEDPFYGWDGEATPGGDIDQDVLSPQTRNNNEEGDNLEADSTEMASILDDARAVLGDWQMLEGDEWGINTYCTIVQRLEAAEF